MENELMTLEEWTAKYKPIARFGSGSNIDLADKNPMCLWTVIQGDEDNNLYIVCGLFSVNRMFHYLTEIPAEDWSIQALYRKDE